MLLDRLEERKEGLVLCEYIFTSETNSGQSIEAALLALTESERRRLPIFEAAHRLQHQLSLSKIPACELWMLSTGKIVRL